MANTVLEKVLSTVQPTISLGSLANGAGRISAQIDNSTARGTRARVGIRVKTGASAPTAGQVYKVYFIRQTATTPLQGGRGGSALGTADAAVSVEPLNAECLGSLQVTTATATTYEEIFTVIDPGAKFSIVVWNASGQAADTTNGNHLVEVDLLCDEVQ